MNLVFHLERSGPIESMDWLAKSLAGDIYNKEC
jgi:hypothetical protein